MKKAGKVLFLLAFLLILSGLGWRNRDFFIEKFSPSEHELVLTGNVDDRQINLSFIVPERVAEILVEEGSVVKKGDLLGTLETVRIENRIEESKTGVAAAQAQLDKAVNGNRKEEIAMAEAGVRIVKAQIKAAENKYKRSKELEETTNAASKQDVEDAESSYNMLLAELDLAQENLNRQLAGSRQEDIDAARASLERAKAVLNIQEQNLADTKLFAPCDGIIRSRILEPGEMSSPQITALQLAVVSPKWIRVYLSEALLPKIQVGDKTVVEIDGFSERKLDGWVGFISPNAEFTPKNVETKELRTSLVYEVRVFVNDPENLLKLGIPTTVSFPGVLVVD